MLLAGVVGAQDASMLLSVMEAPDAGPPSYDYTQAEDESTNTNHGACSTTNIWSADGDDFDMDFTGATDHIQIADSAQLDITGDMSISLWFKPTNLAPDWQRLFHKNSAYALQGSTTDGSIRVFNYADNSRSWSSASYTNGGWQHLVFTKSGGTCTWYKDTVDVTSDSSISPTFSTSDVDVYIGIDEDESSGAFSGHIANIAVYDTALTSGNVTTLYNAGRHAAKDTVSVTNLVGFWAQPLEQ